MSWWTICLALGWVLLAVSASAQQPPNLVIILADDLGQGDLGCYNAQSKIPTPRLDQLAAQGMRFFDAHSPSAVCSPTRYGLLTGRYAWRTSLKQGVLNGHSPLLISTDRLTLPKLLRQAGYTTACVGKWHLGLGSAMKTDYGQPLQPGPLEVGFDYFFGIPASLDMPPYLLVENRHPVQAATGTTEASRHRRQNGGGFWRAGSIAPDFRFERVLPQIAEKSIEFIDGQQENQPFFLYVALTAPHTPWMPIEPFRGKTPVGYYGDFTCQVDATIGQIIDALARKGMDENTIVIATSDNGAHWPQEDIDRWGHRANGNWRGQKADIHEGGHRVPLIVRWPQRVTAGTRSDATICLTDLMATLAEGIGVPVPRGSAEDSFSFLPVISDPQASHNRPAVIHHSSQGMFAVRSGDWKMIDGLGSGGFTRPQREVAEPEGPTGQLYNLQTDPQESTNLYLERPEIVHRLNEELRRALAASPTSAPVQGEQGN